MKVVTIRAERVQRDHFLLVMASPLQVVEPLPKSEWNGPSFLCPEKQKKFLDGKPPKEQKIIRFVWEHSRYFTTDQLLTEVKQACEKFLRETRNEPPENPLPLGTVPLGTFEKFTGRAGTFQEGPPKNFILFLPRDKWGSEQWLATLFYEHLGCPGVITTLKNLSKGEHHILLLDDAIYSGTNLLSLIDEQTYDLAHDAGMLQSELLHGGWKLIFHLVVGLSSPYGTSMIHNRLLDMGVFVHIYTGSSLKPIMEIVEDSGFPMDWKLYNRLLPRASGVPQIEIAFDEPDYNATTVWLEHKMPNEHGSVPFLLEPVLLKPVDRSPIEKAKDHPILFKILTY